MVTPLIPPPIQNLTLRCVGRENSWGFIPPDTPGNSNTDLIDDRIVQITTEQNTTRVFALYAFKATGNSRFESQKPPPRLNVKIPENSRYENTAYTSCMYA